MLAELWVDVEGRGGSAARGFGSASGVRPAGWNGAASCSVLERVVRARAGWRAGGVAVLEHGRGRRVVGKPTRRESRGSGSARAIWRWSEVRKIS